MKILTKALLIAARAKIADPANWTRETFFRDAEGRDTHGLHPHTTCMCAAGALGAALADANPSIPGRLILGTDQFSNGWHELNELTRAATCGAYVFIQSANDQGGHEAVLKVYDYAIEVTNP